MPVSGKGNWPKVAIGGLVLVNLVLVALLVLRQPTRPQAAVPVVVDSPSPAQSWSATRSVEPTGGGGTPMPTATVSATTPTPKPQATSVEPPTEPVRSTRLLAVNSDTLAWRAVFGACPTAPEVEVTRDGGRTWKRTAARLRSVSRLRSYNESAVFAVGGAEDCDTRYVATGSPAEPWGQMEGMLEKTWYRLPTETSRVHAPSGRLSSPCKQDLGDFAGLGTSNAAALCGNGQVRLTMDGGRSWRDLKGGKAGLAIGADDGVYALAMRRDDCDGVAVTVLDPGARRVKADEVRCAPVDRVAADQVAVSVRGQIVWLWAGSEVAVSTDRGRNWERAS